MNYQRYITLYLGAACLLLISIPLLSAAQNAGFPEPKVVKAGKPKPVDAGILYTFRNYGVDEGIIQSQVVAMCQDSRGNVWFGTLGGVTKYDGETFTHFTTKEGLSHNSVFSILKKVTGVFIEHTGFEYGTTKRKVRPGD